MSKPVIGLDLGGTTIKARVVPAASSQAASIEPGIRHGTTIQWDTEARRGPDHVIDRLIALAKHTCDASDVSVSDCLGVGIAAPGPLDGNRGIILRSVNLPGWENVALSNRISNALALPATLINDATAACHGEHRAGGGRGCRHMAMLTLGTGIGGGVVSDGQLLFGAFGHGAELGHMIVHPGGWSCACGQRGCLEAYAGGKSLKRQAVEAGVIAQDESEKIPALIAQVKKQSGAAIEIWDACCEAIALACVTLQHVANPELILLGGGIAGAGATLTDRVQEAVGKLSWRLADDLPRIELAQLGNDAGVIGAAAWFIEMRAGEKAAS